MNQETRQCQNCKGNFTIDASDFDFCEKLNVPLPTWCYKCGMIRRMSFRNERILYKRKCNAPKHSEDIISIYSSDKPLKIFDQKYWWSDDWDQLGYGRTYDFSKPFFEQFRTLINEVPSANFFVKNSVNCDYCNVTLDNKNCYLYFGSGHNENLLYSNGLNYCKDCVDCGFDMKIELNYEVIDSFTSYNLVFSHLATDCSDSMFLFNCRNCSNCFGCINLRNKSYCMFNRQYSKEEYKKKLQEFDLGSFDNLTKTKQIVREFFLKNIFPSAIIVKSQNVSGNNIFNSKNCHNCFDAFDGIENGRDLYIARSNSKDLYRSSSVGWSSELIYEDISVIRSYNVKFSSFCWDNHDLQYCDNCHNCHNLFGCAGLRNKQYCILNKQYTKEEYEELVPKIIDHMNQMPYVDKKGRVYKYGEFFPSELSPFCYNETVAQEYFPLTKEQAIERGYTWKDPEQRNYEITIQAQDLPDHIKDVKDDILNQIIGCAHHQTCNEQCTQAFKIIPRELQFYRRMNLPLPRLCPNCRHYQRLKQRNPLRLWPRKCQCAGQKSSNGVYLNTVKHPHGDQPCPNEFQTPYAPDRPEIVYCEACYLKEVV